MEHARGLKQTPLPAVELLWRGRSYALAQAGAYVICAGS